jgi:hypothetical protein
MPHVWNFQFSPLLDIRYWIVHGWSFYGEGAVHDWQALPNENTVSSW